MVDPMQDISTFDIALAFFGLFVLDLIWAVYTKHIIGKSPWLASFWSSIIILLNGTITVAYVGRPWLLIPAALGAFIGTFVAVKWIK